MLDLSFSKKIDSSSISNERSIKIINLYQQLGSMLRAREKLNEEWSVDYSITAYYNVLKRKNIERNDPHKRKLNIEQEQTIASVYISNPKASTHNLVRWCQKEFGLAYMSNTLIKDTLDRQNVVKDRNYDKRLQRNYLLPN